MGDPSRVSIRVALEYLRRQHVECDDGFYSCPKADNYFGGYKKGSTCTCGADQTNGTLDGIVGRLEKETRYDGAQSILDDVYLDD
jgi:hypothetical protein